MSDEKLELSMQDLGRMVAWINTQARGNLLDLVRDWITVLVLV